LNSLQLERQEEALADTDASLLLAPNSFKALRTRARINLHLEKFDSSIADFKSAIQQAQTEGSATDADVRALQSELKKAEAAMKRSKTKDYYKILGVSRECTEIEIKKAYRRESLIHHPDKVSSFLFPLRPPSSAVLVIGRRRREIQIGGGGQRCAIRSTTPRAIRFGRGRGWDERWWEWYGWYGRWWVWWDESYGYGGDLCTVWWRWRWSPVWGEPVRGRRRG
jgi:DnaJ-domain-containing protein 1